MSVLKSVIKLSKFATLSLCVVLLQGCFEAPPTESTQTGFRGVGMFTTKNQKTVDELKVANTLPEAAPVPLDNTGQKAGEVFQNLQVLGDVGVVEFTGIMTTITAWVSPEEGCEYCHIVGNFASDDIYTKVVSRRMMEMTLDINSQWTSHVGNTGVTCLTCHRGNPVPENIWFQEDGPKTAAGFSSKSYQQNHAAMDVGSTSMLSDPFTKYLTGEPEAIRVIAQNTLTLKDAEPLASTQATENTYSLMVHMSEALGVNCTACHNTRAFTDWTLSPPARTTAWHGLQMVPELNNAYLEPLGVEYPAERLGPLGDAPKVNCTTCHQGVNKPFYGVSMLDDFPTWARTRRE